MESNGNLKQSECHRDFFTFVLVLQKALWDQNTQQKAQQTETVNLTDTTKEVINLLGVLQVSKETKEVNRRSTGGQQAKVLLKELYREE